jgi:predicted RNase H-like HicB family nuclease
VPICSDLGTSAQKCPKLEVAVPFHLIPPQLANGGMEIRSPWASKLNPGPLRAIRGRASARGRGRVCGTVPALPGCTSQGETREEVISMIREAIEVYIESLVAHGDPIPGPVEIERVTVAA